MRIRNAFADGLDLFRKRFNYNHTIGLAWCYIKKSSMAIANCGIPAKVIARYFLETFNRHDVTVIQFWRKQAPFHDRFLLFADTDHLLINVFNQVYAKEPIVPGGEISRENSKQFEQLTECFYYLWIKWTNQKSTGYRNYLHLWGFYLLRPSFIFNKLSLQKKLDGKCNAV